MTKIVKGHEFKGHKPGRCSECGLRDKHPVHHKGKLRADGWSEERKGPDKKSKKPAPFGKKEEG